MTILEEGGEFLIMGDDPRMLLDYLAKNFQLSNSQAKKLVDDKRVFINEKRVSLAKFKLKTNDLVEITKAPQTWQATKSIIYQDKHCLVVNKPANANAVGDMSVERWLKKSLGSDDLAAVHRLDKDTTGCMLFARHKEAQDELENLFRERSITKTYLALVHGQCQLQDKLIDTELDGKEARSIVSAVEANTKASLVSVKIETGRTHQIRRHLSAIGFPLVGDSEYGTKKIQNDVLRKAARQMLHAEKVSFHPSWSNKRIQVRVELPADFLTMLQEIGLPYKVS